MTYTPKERKAAIRQIVRQGHVTGNDFIIAQFGEMPKGLHQDSPLTEEISFLGMGSDPKRTLWNRFTSLGYVQPSEKEHRVYINRFLMSPLGRIPGLLTSRFALSRIHDVAELGVDFLSPEVGPVGLGIAVAGLAATFISSFRYAAFSSVIKGFAPSMVDLTGEEFMHSLALRNAVRSWTVRNNFRAASREFMENEPNAWANVARYVDAAITFMPVGHFQQDTEIMGRLFNLAVRGYPSHGRMAENAAEAQAFLLDMGIKSPRSVRLHFNQEHFAEIRDVFFKNDRWEMGWLFPPSAEINIGISSYRNKKVLEMYWKDCLPLMFGEMCRLLGDSGALERFGYDSQRRDVQGVPQPLRPEAARLIGNNPSVDDAARPV